MGTGREGERSAGPEPLAGTADEAGVSGGNSNDRPSCAGCGPCSGPFDVSSSNITRQHSPDKSGIKYQSSDFAAEFQKCIRIPTLSQISDTAATAAVTDTFAIDGGEATILTGSVFS